MAFYVLFKTISPTPRLQLLSYITFYKLYCFIINIRSIIHPLPTDFDIWWTQRLGFILSIQIFNQCRIIHYTNLSFSSSLFYFCIFILILSSLPYYSILINLDTYKGKFSNLFLFKINLAVLGFLHIHMHFRINVKFFNKRKKQLIFQLKL